MGNLPRIYFGMALHNKAEYLPKTMESLLGQSYGDFNIIAVDDCSKDGTEEIVRQYAAKDKRVVYYKNETRQGEIITRRRAFWEANRRGNIDYYALATDHDIWHPDWLQAHVEVLNKYPEVVMVHPLTASIDDVDKVLPIEPERFETFGMGKSERTRMACLKMVGAGDMVYGLFRASTLAKCDVFPWAVMPDRLLLMEMSVYGVYKQIQKELRYRRYFNYQLPQSERELKPQKILARQEILERQKIILFPDKKAPWHSSLPTIGHAMLLIYHLSIRPTSGSYTNAHLGPHMAYMYLRIKRNSLMREFKHFVRNTNFLS